MMKTHQVYTSLFLQLLIWLNCVWTIFVLTSCNNNKPSKLPEIHLIADTSELNFGEYSLGKVSYYNEFGNIEINNRDIKLRYRGNSSAWYPKKSFALKFTEPVGFNELTNSKRWNLNAEYKERTFLRNKLSYELFRQFSENNYAPKIINVNVFINHNYHGIYNLTERVDANRLGIDKKDTNAVIFKEAPISYPTKEHQKRRNELIEYFSWFDFYKSFPEKGFKKLIQESYYNQRFPSIKKINKKQQIHLLTNFIFHSKDEEFNNEEVFSSYFDLNNILDWHILLLISDNKDGLIKNFYLYKLNKNTPYRFSPWDYDHGYGRDGDGELSDTSFIQVSKVKLLNRLLETNAFDYKQKLYIRFMRHKKHNILTYKNIEDKINKYSQTILPFITKNEAKWPIDSIDSLNGSDFNNEIKLLKNWIKKRLIVVESYLETLSNDS